MFVPCSSRRFLAVLVIVALSTAGCATRQGMKGLSPKPIYRSSHKAPQWVTHPPDTPDYFTAVGIATNMSSLEEGQRAAVAAAVSDIVTYMGIRAEVFYRETQSELVTQVTSQLTARGAARVTSGRMVEMYYEVRWQFKDGRSRKVHDVYVLVAIPLVRLEQERRRIKQEAAARRALAERLLNDGMRARETGDIGGALTRWVRLLDLLEADDAAGVTAREARIEIARLTEDIEIRAEAPATETVSERVRVEARLRQRERSIPIANLPLRAFFLRGAGEIDTWARTDDDGVASIEIRSVSSGRPVILAVGVDVNRLVPSLSTPGHETAVLELAGVNEKVAEVVLVPPGVAAVPDGIIAGRRLPAGRPTTSLEPRGSQRSLAGDRVKMVLLPGRERIYAPGGRPVTCAAFLLELEGSVDAVPSRRPLNVALVLDRSGSMENDDKLDYLKEAARLLVANLAPHDVFSLVTYAEEADVVSPAGTVSDPLFVQHAIEMMRAKGTTNLSGGMIEGIEQAKTYSGEEMLSRVILLSDGLANKGVTDPDLLGRYAASAAKAGVSITTIGLGSDFDEELLMTLADEGQGSYYYARDPDEIPGILATEMYGLASIRAQRITIELRLDPGVEFLNSLGIPFKRTAGGIQFRVGQLAAGERVRVAFQLELPPAKPGPVNLGRLEVGYDNIRASGTRSRREFPLVTNYTRSIEEAERSQNEHVTRFVHILAIMDSMLLAQRSGDSKAIQEVLRYVETELPRLRSWVQQDDSELKKLAEMLQHCLMLLREELQDPSVTRSTSTDVAKEISYKLYRLRHHPVWEGEGKRNERGLPRTPM